MTGSAVGVDRGVVVAVATSDGKLRDRGFLSDGERRRALQLQRRLSRADKHSRSRAKTRQALSKTRARERHRRQDFCARTAHELATGHALVVIEGLKTKQMTRTAKGNIEAPGSNVKAKSGLNRAILSKGWHKFALALESASRYSGTRVVTVPPRHTSQRCSQCGHVDPKSRESQAVFRCTHCAHTEHADVNAAKNILAAGLAVTACEDPPQPSGWSSRRSRNQQEPVRNYCSNPAPQRESWNPRLRQGEDVNSQISGGSGSLGRLPTQVTLLPRNDRGRTDRRRWCGSHASIRNHGHP